MKNFWTPQTEKIAVIIGSGITGYSVLGKSFGLPALPEIMSKTWVGQISLLTVAAGLTIWGAIVLAKKY